VVTAAGDKPDEAHTSEEELGVTVPRPVAKAAAKTNPQA
jgi:hypothetical protein